MFTHSPEEKTLILTFKKVMGTVCGGHGYGNFAETQDKNSTLAIVTTTAQLQVEVRRPICLRFG